MVLVRPNCPWMGAAVTLDVGWDTAVAAEYGLLCLPRLMGSHRTWEAGQVRTLGDLSQTLGASQSLQPDPCFPGSLGV